MKRQHPLSLRRMISIMEKHRKPHHWWLFWEDQHPLARNNVAVLGLMLAVWLILLVITYIAPRVLSVVDVFRLAAIERIWSITSFILIFILLFNCFRILIRWTKNQVPFTSVALAVLVLPVVAALTLYIPSFLHATVSYKMGDSFGTVFDEYQKLCDDWEATYGQQPTIALRPSEVDLGYFANRQEVEVWRDRSVILFDFGDEEQRYGLACVLGGGVPHTDGRTDDFTFRHIDKNYYEFVEHKDRQP